MAFFFTFSPLAWTQIQEKNSCVACHSDFWEETKQSIHTQQGISCQHCHGGDPSQMTKELAKGPGTGYLGIPGKRQMVETCGSCHSDVEKMNPYGTATDQLARYKTSVHGKRLFLEGDTRVAGCSDCHGYHNVLPVNDPQSPVYPLNLPATCDRCHGNPWLMEKYHLPSNILENYRKSVHGKALFEKKNFSAATCVSCHGSHGAVPPGVKEISATCGKCHVNEKKFFLESPHAPLREKGRFSECISCHGYHEVHPATPQLFDQSCLHCHDTHAQAFAKGQWIKESLIQSEKRFHGAEALVQEASEKGMFIEEENASLKEIRTRVIEMKPLQHALSPEKISELRQEVERNTSDLETKIRTRKRSLALRKWALLPIWIFVAVMVAALWVRYKRFKNDKKS